MSDLLVEVLQRQLSGDGGLSDGLQQAAASNPQMQLISQLLAQREEQLKGDLERQELDQLADQEEIARLEEQRERATEVARRVDAMAAELESTHRQLDEMAGDLDAAYARLDDLAAAVGACPACWGEDPACRFCRGRGCPGSLPPDPEAFDAYVRPAAQLFTRLRDTARPPRPGPRSSVDIDQQDPSQQGRPT